MQPPPSIETLMQNNWIDSHKGDAISRICNPLRGWFTASGVKIKAFFTGKQDAEKLSELVVKKLQAKEMTGKSLRCFSDDVIKKAITTLIMEKPQDGLKIAFQTMFHASTEKTRSVVQSCLSDP